MAVGARHATYTLDEYLAFEELSNVKHEYLDPHRPGRRPRPPRGPRALRAFSLAVLLGSMLACAPGGAPPDEATSSAETGVREGGPAPVEWAIAIHGGAGTIPKDMAGELRQAYVEALRQALRSGADALAGGETALDVCESVVRAMEDDPLFNAGRGAVFNHEGEHELDASIMDGRDLSAGAVGAVRTVRHPVTLARRVMEETGHVLLVADGAEAFADAMGVERVDNAFFDTDRRREALERKLEEERAAAGGAGAGEAEEQGTVGCTARDVHGDLAAATSTGGLTAKRFGRIGDTPIVGAGTYADNRTAALSGTGKGEEFIRHAVAYAIAQRMALLGESLADAQRVLVHDVLPDDGGVIGVDSRGAIAWAFNTPGMYRGAADSAGRFEVAIWEEAEPSEE